MSIQHSPVSTQLEQGHEGAGIAADYVARALFWLIANCQLLLWLIAEC
jgi:hypothetical protein